LEFAEPLVCQLVLPGNWAVHLTELAE